MYKEPEKLVLGNILPGPFSGVAMINKIEDGTTRNGNPYLRVFITDGEMTQLISDFDSGYTTMTFPFPEGSVVIVSGLRSGQYLNLKNVVPYTGTTYSAVDFVRSTEEEGAHYFDDLLIHLQEDEYFNPAINTKSNYDRLYTLAIKLLTKNKAAFCISPAGMSVHHDVVGGLAYHTFRMVKMAEKLVEVYDFLNSELLICGAALHDIGKIREMGFNPYGAIEYTVDGNLFGHAYMGAQMVQEEANLEGSNYNPEEVRLLTHLLLSHHGKQEHGAVVPPAIPEAKALNYIDMLDADMWKAEELYRTELTEPGSATPTKAKPLYDKLLYRPDYFNGEPVDNGDSGAGQA